MRFIAAVLLLTTCVAFGGVAFGVNPVGPLRESYIGYSFGSITPYISMNIYNTSGHYYDYSEYYDSYDDSTRIYADTVKWIGAGVLPTLGAKWFLSQTSLKPYLRLSTGIPFWFLYAQDDDEYWEDEIEEFNEIIKRPIILTTGAGVEYYLADAFSIGGEFIYRFGTGGVDDSDSTDYGDGSWRLWEEDTRVNIGATSAGLWFNYYFQ